MGKHLLFKTYGRTVEQLEKEMLGSKINGKPFVARTTNSVVEICGDIGQVYPPADYAVYPHGRIYSLHCTQEGMLGYAAVRFNKSTEHHPATFVIDTFGVLKTTRTAGLGRKLFDFIKKDVDGTVGNDSWRSALLARGTLSEEELCTLSIQSTFDFESYSRALSRNTVPTNGTHVITIDMDRVLADTHGSCDFWRKMGFVGEKIVYNGEFSVASPIIMMWQKIV